MNVILGKDCGPPPSIYKAVIIGGDLDSSALYKCEMGLMFSDGMDTHTSWCQDDLSWSMSDAECIGEL